VPKRGFSNSRFRKSRDIVKVGDLQKLAQEVVRPADLAEAGLVKNRTERIKVLSGGTLKRAVTVHAHGFSAGARKAIEQAGGKAEIIS